MLLRFTHWHGLSNTPLLYTTHTQNTHTHTQNTRTHPEHAHITTVVIIIIIIIIITVVE